MNHMDTLEYSENSDNYIELKSAYPPKGPRLHTSFKDIVIKSNSSPDISTDDEDYMSDDEDYTICSPRISPRKSPRKLSKKRTRSGNNKVHSAQFDYTEVNVCKLKHFPDELNNLTYEDRIERAGVIIYMKIGNEIIFCMGIDYEHTEYSDFGGGVKKKDGAVIKGGLRELSEESLGIFGKINSDELNNFLLVYTKKTAIMFIKINVEQYDMINLFDERLKIIKEIKPDLNPEMKKIEWISCEQFISLIHNNMVNDKKMYSKIADICYRAYNKHNFISKL